MPHIHIHIQYDGETEGVPPTVEVVSGNEAQSEALRLTVYELLAHLRLGAAIQKKPLGRVMLDTESPQSLYSRLVALVGKVEEDSYLAHLRRIGRR